MSDYLTPAETVHGDREDAYIVDVLAQAATNEASLITAMRLGEPADVVHSWVDRLYDQLRARLTPEQRLRAVILLLQDEAEETADKLIAAVTR